jgi:hypothetical protein
MHLRYAEEQGVLDEVEAFLYSLKPGDWYYESLHENIK